MNLNKTKQLLRVCKMYYELGKGQDEIAKLENISISTVSRLMSRAVVDGFVKVTVNYPIYSVAELEDQFKRSFGLKNVFIAPVIVDDQDLILQDTCIALANDLSRIVRNGDIIGVSWGDTMNCLCDHLKDTARTGVKIVQLNGGVPKQTIETGSNAIIAKMAQAFNATGYTFPVPALVDNSRIADALKEDSQVKHILQLAEKCNILIFSIGRMSEDSVIFQSGYFQDEEYASLSKKGAVGDICARFFNIHGEIVDKDFDSRVMGISLEELKRKENKIVIVSGLEKVDALLGALKGGYVNSLYIDENTAKAVIAKYIGE